MKKQEVFVFPTSYAQQRLWFLDQLIPGNAAYNISRSIPWRGCLEVKALETSLNEMARRHESLRTCFGTKEGEPFQVILPAMSLPLSVVNLQARPAPTRRAEARRLAQEEAQRPFDLARAPLLRPTLMLLQEEYSLFLLTMHHLISDRWSMQVFFRELTELYYALVDHRPFPLPDSPIQYADFAVWQRQWLHGERFTSQLNYWKQKLAGSPGVLQLPTDRPRPAVQAFQGECQSRLLPQGLTEPLRALGQREGATLFMTMLAAFKVLLHRYTDQTDILVGSPIANRTRTELEGLIGFFVNTLVLRTDLSGDPTFRELLQRVRQTALEAFAHQDLPFERLVAELNPDRHLGYNPLVQILFVFQNLPREERSVFAGVPASDRALSSNTYLEDGAGIFDLTFCIESSPAGLWVVLDYNIGLFETSTITRMLGHFERLLQGILADPSGSISTLPLLSEIERRQILVEWNDTAVDYPRDHCVHQLFEIQAEAQPEAEAIVFRDQRLTYRELNERANQWARHLQMLGLGPEVVAALYVERSLEMAVGLLAILKAGGAYLPLEPGYPRERLALMLEETHPSVLLTQERLNQGLPRTSAKIVRLDRDAPLTGLQQVDNPRSGATSENLAYVIFTSGSDGAPKGVLMPHQALVNHSLAVGRTYRLDPNDRVLQFASLSFDRGR